jgi:hypothetical protein
VKKMVSLWKSWCTLKRSTRNRLREGLFANIYFVFALQRTFKPSSIPCGIRGKDMIQDNFALIKSSMSSQQEAVAHRPVQSAVIADWRIEPSETRRAHGANGREKVARCGDLWIFLASPDTPWDFGMRWESYITKDEIRKRLFSWPIS